MGVTPLASLGSSLEIQCAGKGRKINKHGVQYTEIAARKYNYTGDMKLGSRLMILRVNQSVTTKK